MHGLTATGPGTPLDPNAPQGKSALEVSEAQARKTAILGYLRSEAMGLMPNMSDDIRDSAKWAINGFHSQGGFFSLDLSSLTDDGDVQEEKIAHPAQLAEATDPMADATSWLASTNYHHYSHGFLPTRDAMALGSHAKQSLFDRTMQFDLHPYYAQNYFTTRGYYGTDIALNLVSHAEAASTNQPWGKIVVGYVNGDGNLMDNGRGLDIHSELQFNDTVSLNSGIRQHDIPSSGNYVLLQWKWATD